MLTRSQSRTMGSHSQESQNSLDISRFAQPASNSSREPRASLASPRLNNDGVFPGNVNEGVRSKRARIVDVTRLSSTKKGSGRTSNREKWRQQNVNRAFVNLRRLVPTYPHDKRLSKNEILRMAIKYIRLLESILDHSTATEQ